MSTEKALYCVAQWSENFENSESRKLKQMRFVCVPNKHDGKSYRRLTRQKEAVSLYCAWQLILQLASKMPIRGVLADYDGPLDAEDMADKTGFPVSIFEKALRELISEKIAWLEVKKPEQIIQSIAQSARFREILPALPEIFQYLPESPDVSRNLPDSSGDVPTPQTNVSTENAGKISRHPPESPDAPGSSGKFREMSVLKGREGKGREGPPTVPLAGGHEPADLLSQMQKTYDRIGALFGREKKRRLSEQTRFQMSQVWPITEDELELIAWFKSQPANEKIIELRARSMSAESLIADWTKQLDYARAYRALVQGGKKNRAAIPDPDGWREAAKKVFGDAATLPDHYAEFTEDAREMVDAELKKIPA